ncbi:MAG TPA: patatin-like phospholipase family protein [Chitinophagaceae bacterium]|nr:patatin-like phospholipase family protein [Chitinophagaceae bacterium]
MTLTEHLSSTILPKRILSLDGGGIRGAITIGYLEKVEELLRARYGGREDFRLCDYFDLIGGTSTGSIIAGFLAIGMNMTEVKEKYLTLGGMIFHEKNEFWEFWKIKKALHARYDDTSFNNLLETSFRDENQGNITLGSPMIRTGLCIMAKRADTNSTWTLNNHPADPFFDSDLGRNGAIALKLAIRASSAAPTYFIPETFDVGNKQLAAFVDGGVSSFNNPSLGLLMVATMKGYGFRWATGENNLFMLSVGTGTTPFKSSVNSVEGAWLASWALEVPDMLMQDASALNHIMMQWISRGLTKNKINLQLGAMENDLLPDQPLLTYTRYNAEIREDYLGHLGFVAGTNYISIADLMEMSNGNNAELLYKIGRAAADAEVSAGHFPPQFDLPGTPA